MMNWIHVSFENQEFKIWNAQSIHWSSDESRMSLILDFDAIFGTGLNKSVA